MLHQLVYVSVRKAECDAAEIDKILAASRRNNGKLNITGVLLYSDTHFFQYLEGDEGQITALYERIKGDPRHGNVVLIAKSTIDQRIFPSWQMGDKRLDNNSIEFRTELSDAEQAQFQKILLGDAEQGGRAIRLMQKLFSKQIQQGVAHAR